MYACLYYNTFIIYMSYELKSLDLVHFWFCNFFSKNEFITNKPNYIILTAIFDHQHCILFSFKEIGDLKVRHFKDYYVDRYNCHCVRNKPCLVYTHYTCYLGYYHFTYREINKINNFIINAIIYT